MRRSRMRMVAGLALAVVLAIGGWVVVEARSRLRAPSGDPVATGCHTASGNWSGSADWVVALGTGPPGCIGIGHL